MGIYRSYVENWGYNLFIYFGVVLGLTSDGDVGASFSGILLFLRNFVSLLHLVVDVGVGLVAEVVGCLCSFLPFISARLLLYPRKSMFVCGHLCVQFLCSSTIVYLCCLS